MIRANNIGLWPTAFVALFFVACASIWAPQMLSSSGFYSLIQSCAVLAPAVIGVQLLLISGKFDLSIGSTAAMAGILSGLTLLVTHSAIAALVVACGAGILAGFLNSLLTERIRIDPLIATLATMGIFRSIALGLTDGKTVSGFRDSLPMYTTVPLLGVDVVTVSALALWWLVALGLKWFRPLNRLYFVGSNPSAAHACGISVARTTVLGFVAAGIGASLSGFVQLARSQAATPLVFQELALESIAACVIGGSGLKGGKGSIHGAMLGLLIVVFSRNLVVSLQGSVYWRYFIIGIILLLVAAIHTRNTAGERELK